MIPILEIDSLRPEDILERSSLDAPSVEAAVDEILERVRREGDSALLDYTRRFDGVALTELRVSEEELNAAREQVGEDFWHTLELSAENIRRFHSQQLHKDFVLTDRPGIVMGQRYSPIERVGICVPASPKAFPSTVLMNVIPAKLAGVSRIVLVTAPEKDGSVSPAALAAAKIAGATDIFKLGGAQAVAALAYGTESVPRVDKIVGPGGIFVATAKKKVFGLVGIDMIAGPSEIVVLADGASNPAWVAADLLGQAEHDALATAVLVTESGALAAAVQKELEKQIEALPRREIAEASLKNRGRILVTESLERCAEAVNLLAPEHLELSVEDPFALLPRIRNAGSVFLGRSAPEALGDYFAGPNHTLPTSGTARFSSPLSVDDFVKKSSFLYYTQEALEPIGRRVADFAEAEGLRAHAESVRIRCKNCEKEGQR